MKIFPEKDYLIELNNDSSIAISNLINQTLPKEQYVTNWKDQAFIGDIKNNEFEISLSKELYGSFCTLKGRIDKTRGTLKVLTSKKIKIIFILIILFIISGIIGAIFYGEMITLVKLIMAIPVFRFIFLELGFRIISKNAINKLTEIIEIQKLEENVAQQYL
ncbi:hypothetical protein [uncultured Winogradskyella sp.]|uniref:hypothetical protein n=1 Tax=uncultured Winogradskyella sp. TaxID=395353 RepID=UPI0030EDEE73|tara:strand:+ start:22 stop:507 length:486 start_codon:yes stop_codon:yes gene_type:complete